MNVQWEHFDLTTLKKFRIESKDFDRYCVKKGDLLICEGGDVGRAAIWRDDSEMYYQNALHRVRFKAGIMPEFFLLVLQSYKISGKVDDVCSGVTIKHFTQGAMRKLAFPLPPIKEQLRIVEIVSRTTSLLDNIIK